VSFFFFTTESDSGGKWRGCRIRQGKKREGCHGYVVEDKSIKHRTGVGGKIGQVREKRKEVSSTSSEGNAMDIEV